jgi:hypothetical protein
MVERMGAAVCFDLAETPRLDWRRDALADRMRVYDALLTDEALVLAGAELPDGSGTGPSPIIRLIDPETGALLRQITPHAVAGIRWLEVGPYGQLVYATTAGIEAADLHAGEILWSNRAPEAQQTEQGWAHEEHVVVSDAARQLFGVRVLDGALTPPFSPPLDRDWLARDLRDVVFQEGRIYAHYAQRIVRYDVSGAILGADVIGDERDYRWLLPSRDRFLLLSGLKPVQGQGARRGGLSTRYVYQVYALSPNCRVLGEPRQLPSLYRPMRTAALLEGWLLASTDMTTIAIPMPTSEE